MTDYERVKKWRNKHRAYANKLQAQSWARRYARDYATKDDMKQLEQIFAKNNK